MRKTTVAEIAAICTILIVISLIVTQGVKEARVDRKKQHVQRIEPVTDSDKEPISVLNNGGRLVYVYEHVIDDRTYHLFFHDSNFQVERIK